MPTLSSASILAAVLVALALAGLGGYRHGIDTERGRGALAMQAAIVATFEATRDHAAAESRRRQAQAVQDERAAAAAREARLKGQRHALENDRPACRWPADRRLHLNAAIAAANGAATAPAHGLPHPLSTPAEPAR